MKCGYLFMFVGWYVKAAESLSLQPIFKQQLDSICRLGILKYA